MRIYSLIGRTTSDVIEIDGCTIERLTDIEVTYINWAIEMDGKFENGNWAITIPPIDA